MGAPLRSLAVLRRLVVAVCGRACVRDGQANPSGYVFVLRATWNPDSNTPFHERSSGLISSSNAGSFPHPLKWPKKISWDGMVRVVSE